MLRDSISAAAPPDAFAPLIAPAVAHEHFLQSHAARRAAAAPASSAAAVSRGGSSHEGAARRGVMFRTTPNLPGELSRGGSAQDGAPHVSGTTDPPFTTWPPASKSREAGTTSTATSHAAATAPSIDAKLQLAAAAASPPAAVAAATDVAAAPAAAAAAEPARSAGPRPLPSRARLVPGLTEPSAA